LGTLRAFAGNPDPAIFFKGIVRSRIEFDLSAYDSNVLVTVSRRTGMIFFIRLEFLPGNFPSRIFQE
jgi:hypothetical protein